MTGRLERFARVTAALISLQIVVNFSAIAAPARAADTLDTAIAKLVDGTFGPKPCVAPDAPRSIGMWVFEEGKVPLGAAAAKRLHEELLSRLLAARPKCIDVLDSAGIGIIIEHLNKSGALADNGGSVIAALTAAHQNVDLVVMPSLYVQAGKTVLALRTVERVSAKTLALTAPVIVPEKFLGQDASYPAVNLDAAIKAASRYFLEGARDLKELRTLGVFFEDTSAQPAAGRYVMDLLIAALTQDPSNVLTGKVLKVRGLTIEPAPKDDGTVSAQQLEPSGSDDSGYDLSGRYWIRGNAIDLRLSLKRQDGATLAWQGTIRIAEFKDLELRPTNPAAALQPLPKAVAFQLTSPKGAGPIYRPGEELTLFLRLGQDAFVYCFYVDTKGGILTVLPNKFRLDDPKANRFAAKVLHRLPDESKDPFRFRFTADTLGEELMVCFASIRDVRADLPGELFPDQIRTLPFLTLDKLRQIFADLKDTKVSEASVTVTVAR